MTTCINCYVDYSPIWRKGYCNACGIHYSKYGVHKNHIDIINYIHLIHSPATVSQSIMVGDFLNF